MNMLRDWRRTRGGKASSSSSSSSRRRSSSSSSSSGSSSGCGCGGSSSGTSTSSRAVFSVVVVVLAVVEQSRHRVLYCRRRCQQRSGVVDSRVRLACFSGNPECKMKIIGNYCLVLSRELGGWIPTVVHSGSLIVVPNNPFPHSLRLGSIWPFFCVKMACFYVSAHTVHSLGQVTVTVKRILAQGLGSRV